MICETNFMMNETATESSMIKVIGVGGGGGNAVNYMYNNGNIQGVDMIVCNTDKQDLDKSPVKTKIQLGPILTRGTGAGANPEIAKESAIESIEEIYRVIDDKTEMVFITATMGGGTGTGAAPVIAKAVKDINPEILSIAVVATPFDWEGSVKMKRAMIGIESMIPYVDSLLIIDNSKTTIHYGRLGTSEIFAKADKVLADAVKSIADIITHNGHINVDLADIKTILKNSKVALIGYASASGENRVINALETALNAPLLRDNRVKGAQKTLFNIISPPVGSEFEVIGDELSMLTQHIEKLTGFGPEVIWGMGYDNKLTDEVVITIIFAGFDKHDETVIHIPAIPDWNAKKEISMEITDENDIIIPDKLSPCDYSKTTCNSDTFEEIPTIDRIK